MKPAFEDRTEDDRYTAMGRSCEGQRFDAIAYYPRSSLKKLVFQTTVFKPRGASFVHRTTPSSSPTEVPDPDVGY